MSKKVKELEDLSRSNIWQKINKNQICQKTIIGRNKLKIYGNVLKRHPIAIDVWARSQAIREKCQERWLHEQ